MERDEGPQRRLDVFHIKLHRERERDLTGEMTFIFNIKMPDKVP